MKKIGDLVTKFRSVSAKLNQTINNELNVSQIYAPPLLRLLSPQKINQSATSIKSKITE